MEIDLTEDKPNETPTDSTDPTYKLVKNFATVKLSDRTNEKCEKSIKTIKKMKLLQESMKQAQGDSVEIGELFRQQQRILFENSKKLLSFNQPMGLMSVRRRMHEKKGSKSLETRKAIPMIGKAGMSTKKKIQSIVNRLKERENQRKNKAKGEASPVMPCRSDGLPQCKGSLPCVGRSSPIVTNTSSGIPLTVLSGTLGKMKWKSYLESGEGKNEKNKIIIMVPDKWAHLSEDLSKIISCAILKAGLN